MNRLFLLLLITVGCSATAASPLDGEWTVVWSCKGATEFYAERCAEGRRDYFTLDLYTDGKSLCGFHIATAHLGNRVDEGDLLDGRPTITGTANGASVVSHK
jgi:hypothetical protein